MRVYYTHEYRVEWYPWVRVKVIRIIEVDHAEFCNLVHRETWSFRHNVITTTSTMSTTELRSATDVRYGSRRGGVAYHMQRWI